MKLEHVAINVPDPLVMAVWYVENLGLSVVKQINEPPFMTFLADESGTVMLEIYRNPMAGVPDYWTWDPLVLHLAFVSSNLKEDIHRLVDAGAVLVSENRFDDGSHLAMLRDPWGVAIQLCKRGTPLLHY